MTWPRARLGEVVAIDRRGVQPDDIPIGTRLVGLENISREGKITGWQTVAEREVGSTKFKFDAGHVLYGKLRPYLGKVAQSDFGGVCSTDILPLRPSDQILPGFLRHYLRQPTMIQYASSRATGANLPRLSPQVLESFEVPVPPLGEQERIVEILDRAESALARVAAAKVQLSLLRESVFEAMFGESSLGAVRLATVCTRITDGTHQSPEWSESGHPFIFVSNITGGEINFDTEKRISDRVHSQLTATCPIEVGDVLYSAVGSYGIPAVVRDARKFAFQRHIAHIKPERELIDSDFLAAQLASNRVRIQADSAARGVAQKTVTLTDIKDFQVIVPPVHEQVAFAQVAAEIRRLEARVVDQEELARECVVALADRAFMGQL